MIKPFLNPTTSAHRVRTDSTRTGCHCRCLRVLLHLSNGEAFCALAESRTNREIVSPSKTNAGILLPEKSSKLNSGKVVSVGPGLRDKEGKVIPVSLKEGYFVLLPEYGGTEVKLGDKEFHLYRDEDILGTLHD